MSQGLYHLTSIMVQMSQEETSPLGIQQGYHLFPIYPALPISLPQATYLQELPSVEETPSLRMSHPCTPEMMPCSERTECIPVWIQNPTPLNTHGSQLTNYIRIIKHQQRELGQNPQYQEMLQTS